MEHRQILPAQRGIRLSAFDSLSAVAVGLASGAERIELVVAPGPEVADPLGSLAAGLDISTVPARGPASATAASPLTAASTVSVAGFSTMAAGSFGSFALASSAPPSAGMPLGAAAMPAFGAADAGIAGSFLLLPGFLFDLLPRAASRSARTVSSSRGATAGSRVAGSPSVAGCCRPSLKL